MIIQMAKFANEDELKDFLHKLEPVYSNYSGALFSAGVISQSILGNANVATLTSLEIPELYATDLIARCKTTGTALYLQHFCLLSYTPQS